MTTNLKSEATSLFDTKENSYFLEQIITDECESRAGGFTSNDTSVRPIIGYCVNVDHPTLMGRIRVKWSIKDKTVEQWLPALQGLTFRKKDRVLLQYPTNSIEPIVVGVVDGHQMRPDLDREMGPSLTIENDESLKILTAKGNKLLEIYSSDAGPVVRINDSDTNLELPGKLRINAKEIELIAKQGSVNISASDNVKVVGEEIKLN